MGWATATKWRQCTQVAVTLPSTSECALSTAQLPTSRRARVRKGYVLGCGVGRSVGVAVGTEVVGAGEGTLLGSLVGKATE